MSRSPDVKLHRPDSHIYAPPPMIPSRAVERGERAQALIVMWLTFACTILAIYDLFLLAAGS